MKKELTKIEYPNFDKIIAECKDKIKSKFPQYGNSWKETGLIFADNFWKNRLENEVKEIFENTDSDRKFCLMKNEIIDTINILTMMYEHADNLCKEENEIYKRTWRYG